MTFWLTLVAHYYGYTLPEILELTWAQVDDLVGNIPDIEKYFGHRK